MPGHTGLDDARKHVHLKKEFVSNVSSSEFPGHYYGEDHTWSLADFTKTCTVRIQGLSQRSIEFDLAGVDASIANALRRSLIAEVPTIAIENVYVWNNTSVIQDEVFAHRLGMLPLNVDPRLLESKMANDTPTDQDTIVFHLKVKCERNMQAPKGSTDPEELYLNSEVYSSQLEWAAQGGQADVFKGRLPACTNPNILLAKLRPGQEIEMEMHALKGVGSEHAKWSPVATASYRLLPHIDLLGPIPSDLCDKFASCFSPGVVRVVLNPQSKQKEVQIVNPRNDTVSREILRHSEFEGLVELSRIRDFFLFSVESEGPYSPEELLPEAIKILRSKISVVRQAALNLQQDVPDHEMET